MKINYFIFFLVLLTIWSSCNKEQPPIDLQDNDPCDCAREVSAEFTIGEISTSLQVFNPDTTLTDTIFKDRNVYFNAVEEDAEYTWYIGTEVLDTKSVTRFFASSLAGTNQTISLVVRKNPNTLCLPNDDGYDSISKVLHVSVYPVINGNSVDLGSIEGIYRVKMPHLPDSADITYDVTTNVGAYYFNITNYDGLGSSCMNQADYSGGNYRLSNTKGGTSVTQCDYMQGSIHHKMDGTVEMNFTFGPPSPTHPDYYQRTYFGRKIN